MAKKYIDADRLIEGLKELESVVYSGQLLGQSMDRYDRGQLRAINNMKELVNSLQQEQSIKVYRVENEKEQKGLWRKFDGTWEPLFDMLTDGKCKNVPMDDSPIYQEGGKQWFASAPSKKTLQKWFSKRDLEELTVAGFTITEFEVVEHRKLSDFEYIFTRESIVNKTNINIVDIYPQEQTCDTCSNDKGCVTCKDGELWEGKEQPCEDLKEATARYGSGYCDTGLRRTAEFGFRSGAEWQRQRTPMPEDTVLFNKGVAEGRRLERQDMLKDAVEGEVKIDVGGHPYIEATELYDYTEFKPLAKMGDKVKIVILPKKEDKK